jgi:hypothetical protein
MRGCLTPYPNEGVIGWWRGWAFWLTEPIYDLRFWIYDFGGLSRQSSIVNRQSKIELVYSSVDCAGIAPAFPI